MIGKLLELADGRLVVPLAVVFVGVALVKGGFTLVRFRSQDRKDFLDLFRGHQGESDLWLTVAVRHIFGTYLPASLIRQLMAASQPGRAILEVSSAWQFLEMDDETAELTWRHKHFRNANIRRGVVVVLSTLYFVLASAALFLAYRCVTGEFEGKLLWIAWAYSVLSIVGAFACLGYGDGLKNASVAARRWLGMQ